MGSKTKELILAEFRVQVDGLNIHYKSLGKGLPVILLHGSGNDWREWEKNLAFLAAHFRVYALDLPGFGLSQAPDGPISRAWSIDFIKHFADNLGIERACLIGHSMGAVLAVSLSARYPSMVNKLVLVDSAGLGSLPGSTRFLLSVLRASDRWQGRRRGPKYLAESFDDWQIVNDLPRVKAPTLIVWGRNDIYLPVSRSRLAHSLIPGSRLCIFSGCGHAPQRQYPVKFNKLCLQFLMEKDHETN